MERVTFVTVFDLKGHSGSNVATRSLVDALAARDDVELTLLAPVPADSSDLLALWPRAAWIRLPGRSGWPVIWHLRTALRVRARIRELLRARATDVVAVRLGFFFVPSARLFPVPGCRLVLLIRGSLKAPLVIPGAIGAVFKSVTRRITFGAARRADRLVVAYEAAVGEWRSSVPPDKIEVVPNGADISRFPLISIERARKDLAESGGPILEGPVVGFAGSLRPRHCLEELVRACALLERKGEAPDLLVIGDGPVRPTLEALAAEEGIRHRVHFVGRVPHADVARFLAACDLLYGLVDETKPSNPIKVYEGLATGRPVVTSRQPELVFVEKEGFGVIADSGTVPDVARAVERGLSMEWGHADAERARAYIASNHGWDTLAEAILLSDERA